MVKKKRKKRKSDGDRDQHILSFQQAPFPHSPYFFVQTFKVRVSILRKNKGQCRKIVSQRCITLSKLDIETSDDACLETHNYELSKTLYISTDRNMA